MSAYVYNREILNLTGFCHIMQDLQEQGLVPSKIQIAKALNMSRNTIARIINQLKQIAKQPEHFLQKMAKKVMEFLSNSSKDTDAQFLCRDTEKPLNNEIKKGCSIFEQGHIKKSLNEGYNALNNDNCSIFEQGNKECDLSAVCTSGENSKNHQNLQEEKSQNSQNSDISATNGDLEKNHKNPIKNNNNKTLESNINSDSKNININYNLKEKNTKKRKEILDELLNLPLPKEVLRETWCNFVFHRNEMGKPLSLRAGNIAIKRLQGFIAQGYDPNLLIEESIFRNWQGIFPVDSALKKTPVNPSKINADKQNMLWLMQRSDFIQNELERLGFTLFDVYDQKECPFEIDGKKVKYAFNFRYSLDKKPIPVLFYTVDNEAHIQEQMQAIEVEVL